MEDLHKIWPHRWLNPKLKVITSDIHGTGVEAVQHIEKGETLGVLGGIIVPVSDIEDYRSKLGHVGIQIDKKFFIVPATRQELEKSGVFNHSCEPNCGMGSDIKIVAIRDIDPGKEIAFDYAFTESDFEPFDCTCGSPRCRKIIKPTDWQDKELQKKYGEYFSPYLKRRFSD